MDTLTEKAYNNLKLLLNLDSESILMSEKNKLKLQEEYVQVDNTLELEYAFYFTFHQLFSCNNNHLIYNSNLIGQLDQAIDNIYDNDKLNEVITNNESFKLIIDNIDSKLDEYKERIFYQSPFFTFLKRKHNFIHFFKNILEENNETIVKLLHVTGRTIQDFRKDIHREYYEQEDEESDREEEAERELGEEGQSEEDADDEKEEEVVERKSLLWF